MKNFKDIHINDNVKFIDSKGTIQEGRVIRFGSKRTFDVEYKDMFFDDGTFSYGYVTFNIATGKKASHRNTHGDCIEIL